jgi:NDP-sugar pyrophosphorylase family protein
MDQTDHIDQITPVILAGGLGTRLRAVIGDIPKVLAPVNGRPFLSYLLDQLIAARFKKVILCTGYKGDMVRDSFDNFCDGFEIRYSQEDEPLGTGGALRLALDLIQTDWVLVMNGDSFVDMNLRSLVEWHYSKGADASILLLEVPDTGRFGRVTVGKDFGIESFIEKKDVHGPGWINGGIYLVKRNVLGKLPNKIFISLEREVFPDLVSKGFYGYPCSDGFIDIGVPESYQKAGTFFSCILSPSLDESQKRKLLAFEKYIN